MQKDLMVTKRDGRREKIDLEKIHRVVIWAANGLDQVSPSEVELKAHIQFYDGIKTSDIHETLIKSAADLISETAPDYQYLAARLAIFHLRKRAFIALMHHICLIMLPAWSRWAGMISI